MKTSFSAVSLFLLGSFALVGTGCATEYSAVSATPVYGGTTLPAASRVAVVLLFQGGDPSPEEREDVRALLADYLSGKGSVLVDDPADADYLIHVVLERRNPANLSEWTVANVYSAQSLGVGGDDYYAWPDGIIEDETYDVTTFSYVGFGVFYPVWFDLWDSPWHRRHVVVLPPKRPHHHYWESKWREDRRRHKPDRWHFEPRREEHRPPVVAPPVDRRHENHGDRRDRVHDGRRSHERNWTHDREKRDERHGTNVVRRPEPPPRRPEPPREVRKPEPPKRVVIPGHPNHSAPSAPKEVARPPGRHSVAPAVQPQPRDPRMNRHDNVRPKVRTAEPNRAKTEVRRAEPKKEPPPKRTEVRREEHRDRRPSPPPEKKNDSDRDRDDPRR